MIISCLIFSHRSPLTNAVGPVGPACLVGSSVAIFSSLLQHPSSSLTQLSFVLMMLLAVQYAVQPRLSRKYISPKIKKQTVVLVEEVVKTTLAAAIFFSKSTDYVQSALKGTSVRRLNNWPRFWHTSDVWQIFIFYIYKIHFTYTCVFLLSLCRLDWSLSSSLAIAGLPAMLYALQGVLQYVSYQHLDSVTFNGLTQTKTLSAAFCCWLILKKSQSPIQMVALGILIGSALVFQGYIRPGILWQKNMKIKTNDAAVGTATSTTVISSTKKNDDWVWYGVLPCLGAAFLSGLAGALSQKGLQLTGIGGRDPFLFTIEISFFSAVTLLFNIIRTNEFSKFEWQKQKAYWNWKILIPIFLKASSGVITALVHKYAGSVSKCFALMFGLVLSNMIQLTTKQESLQPYQVLGTIMIMLSTWLHFTNPPII